MHPDYPFTDDEHAAALILLGRPADEAIRDSALMRTELAELSENLSAESAGNLNAESGWTVSPRVILFGQVRPAIRLAADIHADGTILSSTARDAWLAEWTTRLSDADAEQRLDQLERLNVSWSAHRASFYRLLTTGTL